MEHFKPKCKLAGEDGNVFAIIGNVSKTLKENDMEEEAKEFKVKALASNSYGEVLTLLQDYVDVE